MNHFHRKWSSQDTHLESHQLMRKLAPWYILHHNVNFGFWTNDLKVGTIPLVMSAWSEKCRVPIIIIQVIRLAYLEYPNYVWVMQKLHCPNFLRNLSKSADLENNKKGKREKGKDIRGIRNICTKAVTNAGKSTWCIKLFLRTICLSMILMATYCPFTVFIANLTLANVPSPIVLLSWYFPILLENPIVQLGRISIC